ncbi:MAG: fibronectin type III domain-containing protein [Flavobacteriales bacterium]
MSYYKAVFDTARPLATKIPEEWDIFNKMAGNAAFASPPIPYEGYEAALKEQDDAIRNAEFGGIERTNIKRSKEQAVDEIVRRYRSYVTTVADGDTDLILSSGFRHTKPRSSAGAMTQVLAVRHINTGISGELKLRWKPLANVGFYEVEVRVLDDKIDPKSPSLETDLASDDKWQAYSARPASIVISGLTPLVYYAVRVRANGAKGFGPFSEITVVLIT